VTAPGKGGIALLLGTASPSLPQAMRTFPHATSSSSPRRLCKASLLPAALHARGATSFGSAWKSWRQAWKRGGVGATGMAVSTPHLQKSSDCPGMGWPFKVALLVTSLLGIGAQPLGAGTEPSCPLKFGPYLDGQVAPRAAGCGLALQHPVQGGGQALQQRGQVLSPVLPARAALLHEHAHCGQGDAISSQHCARSRPCSWLNQGLCCQ